MDCGLLKGLSRGPIWVGGNTIFDECSLVSPTPHKATIVTKSLKIHLFILRPEFNWTLTGASSQATVFSPFGAYLRGFPSRSDPTDVDSTVLDFPRCLGLSLI